jgi:hypothetical protein
MLQEEDLKLQRQRIKMSLDDISLSDKKQLKRKKKSTIQISPIVDGGPHQPRLQLAKQQMLSC